MSATELRVIKIVTFLLHLAEEGHFKIYRTEVEPLFWKIREVYFREGTLKSQIRLYKALIETEEKLIRMELNTNLAMLFTALMELAEQYLTVTTTEKRGQAWQELLNYCTSNEIMQHISKKMLTEADVKNMHVGNEVAEVLRQL